LLKGLKKLGREEGVTLVMTLLAGFVVLLQRYSGQRDVVVGSPVAGRNWTETEGLIGFFVNTLVLRTQLSGNLSVKELLRKVREVALGAYSNQETPFEKLVEELQPERDMSRNPLFQVLFGLHSTPQSEWRFGDLEVEQQGFDPGYARHDLALELGEHNGALGGLFRYRRDL